MKTLARLVSIAVFAFAPHAFADEPAPTVTPPVSAPASPQPSAPVSSEASATAPAAAEPGRTAKNAVFLELGGNAGIYSINYERFVTDDVSLRAGVGYVAASTDSAAFSLLSVPLLGNYYLGGKHHKLQLGVGLTIMAVSGELKTFGGTSSASAIVPAPTAVVGYRYIPSDGGFAFFAGLTPFIVPGGDLPVLPWAGLSFGAAF